MGGSIVIKQQWLLLKEKNRHDNPHLAAIREIIEAIRRKQKEGHEIIISLDRNETFTHSTGDIARLYREYQLFDPLSN